MHQDRGCCLVSRAWFWCTFSRISKGHPSCTIDKPLKEVSARKNVIVAYSLHLPVVRIIDPLLEQLLDWGISIKTFHGLRDLLRGRVA